MPVKLRLQRHGRKKRPYYFIVAADSKSPRDGRFIERLGSYDPTTVPAKIVLDGDKALTWLNNGAEPTDTVRAILSYKGVLYKKHLVRGLKKGALTQEQVDDLFAKYVDEHEGKVTGRVESLAKAKEDARKKRDAEEAAKRAKAEADAAAAAAPAEEEATEETASEEAAADEVAAETAAAEENNEAVAEAPVVEEAAEAEEAPAAEEGEEKA